MTPGAAPLRRFALRSLSLIVLDKPLEESRRADSNRLPLIITSDRSGVAGGCTDLQIPHIYAAFSAPVCCVLHRIAFPMVSEWYQDERQLHSDGRSNCLPSRPPPSLLS